MYVMEHRCAGKFSGGFVGPFMYVLSPTSTKHKYRLVKMKNKKINNNFIKLNISYTTYDLVCVS